MPDHMSDWDAFSFVFSVGPFDIYGPALLLSLPLDYYFIQQILSLNFQKKKQTNKRIGFNKLN